MNPNPRLRPARQGLATALALTVLMVAGSAQADSRDRGPGRGDDGRATPPGLVNPAPQRGQAQRWFDGAHGHNHYYPRPGWAVRSPPPRAGVVFWGGVGYHFLDGVWYTGGPQGYVVVRPPIGIVVADRPALATVLAIGGLTYLYANGVYYREQPGAGYEVVPPPVDGAPPAAAGKTYVYPKQAQSADQQASDEYECHKWAVGQTGFDPSAAATGQAAGASPARRSDYERARGACLEGRGYTVR